MIKILYVDDEESLLDVGKAFLELSGDMVVDTALSAELAMEWLKVAEYDAIICDYQMPGMNGIEFLRELRHQGNKIPFILFTGKGREEVVIEALNSGVDFYIQKGGGARPQFAELAHKVRAAVAQRQAENAAISQRKRFETLFFAYNEGVALHEVVYENGKAVDYRILEVNPAFERHTGMVKEQVVGKLASEVYRTGKAPFLDVYTKVAETGEVVVFDTYFPPLKKYFSISVVSPVKGQFATVFLDITERKRLERESQAAVEFLRLFSISKDAKDLIREVLSFLRVTSGCEAVAIRLRHGHDYPYYESRGFPQKFLEAESSLCAYDENGTLRLDSKGDPLLECMCGNIISGRFDPTKPFFSSKGSFWTNSTTELLSTTTDEDRQTPTRNRCNKEGYESVALIPLVANGVRIGLIQLNDHRKGLFNIKDIEQWERLAEHLALILVKADPDLSLFGGRSVVDTC